MTSWSRLGAGQRSHASSVLPIHSDDVDAKYHAKASPPVRRRSGTPSQRAFGLRQWIWLLLFVNIVAVVVSIFSSALYFPSAVSDNVVVRQALSQGEREYQSGGTDLEAPAATAPGHAEQSETTADADDGNTQATTRLPAPAPTRAVEQELLQTPATLLPTAAAAAAVEHESKSEQPAPGTIAPAHRDALPEDVAAPEVVTPVPSLVALGTTAPLDSTPMQDTMPRVAADDMLQQTTRSHTSPPIDNIASLIAKMKEKALRGSSPDNGDAAHASEAQRHSIASKPEDKMNDGRQEQQALEPSTSAAAHVPLKLPVSATQLKDEDAIRTNLLVWLKADQGVEMDDPVECRATGAGTSCDVKAWTSQVASPTPHVFAPPTREHLRPLFVPSIHNRNDLPALFFSCPLTNNHVQLHEYMTLFFVLSPAQVETTGNLFKAQKFFGNAPYGQFFFHGGKPGFLSSGGVRELDTQATSGAFYLLTYRLRGDSVELKMNRQHWRRGNGDGDDAFKVRMSNNAALSLGNVKALCDTNAFQGRMAEVLVYDTVLSDARVDDVESYLEQKWWDEPFETAALAPARGSAKPGVTAVPAVYAPPEALVTTDSAVLRVSDRATDADEGEATDQVAVTPTGKPPRDDETVRPEPQATGGDVSESEPTAAADAPSEPLTFNPEDVFEWTPPEAVLATKARGHELAAEWSRRVRETIESIRSFRLGGEVLRAFIRSRKHELLALRQELFA